MINFHSLIVVTMWILYLAFEIMVISLNVASTILELIFWIKGAKERKNCMEVGFIGIIYYNIFFTVTIYWWNSKLLGNSSWPFSCSKNDFLLTYHFMHVMGYHLFSADGFKMMIIPCSVYFQMPYQNNTQGLLRSQ